MVGPYLVQKSKDDDDIWVTNLPTTGGKKGKKCKNTNKNSRVTEDIEEKSSINEDTKVLKCSKYLQALLRYPIHLKDRMSSKKKDSEHVMMWHVPHNSIKNFKPRGNCQPRVNRYGHLLQVIIRDHAVIYDLNYIAARGRLYQ